MALVPVANNSAIIPQGVPLNVTLIRKLIELEDLL